MGCLPVLLLVPLGCGVGYLLGAERGGAWGGGVGLLLGLALPGLFIKAMRARR